MDLEHHPPQVVKVTITRVETPTSAFVVQATSDGNKDWGKIAVATGTPEELATPCPTVTMTFTLPEPGTTPVPNDENRLSYGIGSFFYQIFDQTPGGWWDGYRDPNGAGLWPILFSMVFYWETYTLNDPNFKIAMKEAFSRKLWDSYNSYGVNGWSFYMGGRDPARIRYTRLKAFKGNTTALTDELKNIDGMIEVIASQTYNTYVKDIWNNADWRTGREFNRPWEFGNPTELSPTRLISALSGELPSCNGHCTDENLVYYRSGKLNKNDFHFQDGLKVYNLDFVITPAQSVELCSINGVEHSCVKP